MIEAIKGRQEARKKLACLEVKRDKVLETVNLIADAFRDDAPSLIQIITDDRGRPQDSFFRLGTSQKIVEWPTAETMVSLFADMNSVRQNLQKFERLCREMGLD